VKQNMLAINGQIERDQCGDELDRGRQVDYVKKPPSVSLGKISHGHSGARKQQSERSTVDSDNAQVVEPASGNRRTPCPQRFLAFPNSHRNEYAKKKQAADHRFMLDHVVALAHGL